MDSFEIYHFSLTEEEKEECRRKKIPYFYWYYLKALEQGWGLQQIKELIQNRIKRSIFSSEEMSILASSIAGKIRKLVNMYQDGKGMDVKELNRIFNTEIFTLFNDFMARKNWRKENNKKRMEKLAKKKVAEELRNVAIKNTGAPKKTSAEKKKAKKVKAKTVKKIFSIISKKDNQVLKPTLVMSGKNVKDKECLYFDECIDFSKEQNFRLDCRNCPQQNIEK